MSLCPVSMKVLGVYKQTSQCLLFCNWPKYNIWLILWLFDDCLPTILRSLLLSRHESPEFTDSIRRIEGSIMWTRSRAMLELGFKQGCVCVFVCVCVCVFVVGTDGLWTELVNNKPTQDQTGPQSNQWKVQRLLPPCASVWECVCVCVCAEAPYPWINPQGGRNRSNNDPSSVFISLSLILSYLPAFPPVAEVDVCFQARLSARLCENDPSKLKTWWMGGSVCCNKDHFLYNVIKIFSI